MGASDDFWTVVTDGVEEGDRIVMKTELQEGFRRVRASPREISQVAR